MQAPSATFRREDFPDLSDPGRTDRFLRMLNAFCKGTETYAADQLAGVARKTVVLTAAMLPLKIASPVALPRAVFVAQARDVTTKAPEPVALPNPAWRTDGANIVVHSLGTLDAAKRYEVTFEVRA